jgi:hypothetical protein
MKHNPIADGAIVLVLASLVLLLIVHFNGSSFTEQTLKRSAEIKKIEAFSRTPMKLPPENTDASPRMIYGVVNQAAIKYLQDVYAQMKGDYNQIWNLAIKHNQGDAVRGMHLPIIDNLFPDPGFLRADVLYTARQPYQNAFEEMLRPAAEGAQYPRLDAGDPISQERLEQVVEPLERNLRARYGIPDGGQLTNTQQEELLREKRRAQLDLIRQHAQSIHIYTNASAFQIDNWPSPPNIINIWESQLNLWIQQDIVQTISRTNRVSDQSFSVIQAPIKRLNKISIVPGYVGIDTGGGMSSHGGYNEASSGETKLPDDFSIAPTGRLSNSLYDVRHVWVDMDVDIQQLPVFMDELVQTNFMSVLKMKITDVNEYDLLQHGYFLGSADVVNVHMLIETLWFRDWTVPMMPQAVRDHIGAQNPNGSSQASAQ